MIEQLFTNFGFRALWTPELIVILAIVGFLYFRLIGKWRDRFEASEPVKTKHKVYFILGLVALYFGFGSPLYVAGHMMITFHMTQMVLAFYIAMPLFILGTPKWFFQAIGRKAQGTVFAHVGKVAFNPLLALVFFNGLFSIYHLPLIFDFLMQTYFLHDVYQIVLLVGSFFMWWHMIAPLPSKANLSDLRRIVYIFGNGVLITPACALIIFAGSPLYAVYSDPYVWATMLQTYCLPSGVSPEYLQYLIQTMGPETGGFTTMSLVHDQQLAGIVMKIMQEITFGITIGYVFKQWIGKEKQSDGPSISDIPSTHPIKN